MCFHYTYYICICKDTYSKCFAICIVTGIATDIAITTHIAIPMVLSVYPHVFVGVAGATPSPWPAPQRDSLTGVTGL